MMFRLDEIYDTDKISNNKKVLMEFWSGNREIVFNCNTREHSYYYTQRFDSIEKILSEAISHIKTEAEMPGYNIPTYYANFKPISIAAYWGGKILEGGNNHVSLEPIIRCAADVNNVKRPSLTGGDLERASDIWGKLSENLFTDALGCTDLDMQGPLSTLSMLWNQEDLILSMYEEPEKVHKMLDMVTDFIIQVYHGMEIRVGKDRITGPFWPTIWLPRDVGVELVEDFMPLLSPELYAEFGLPYLERISKEMGGIFFHCCGIFRQHYEILAKSNVNFLGLEFQYPFAKPDELYNCFGSTIAFCPVLSFKGKKEFPNGLDFIKYLTKPEFNGMRRWFTLDGNDKELMEQSAYLDDLI
jgi:hypothetical protein